MRLPIIKELRKREYREIASFQDMVIDLLYRTDSSIILHGGTTVWRCFSGNRFSTDIDAYLTNRINAKALKRRLSALAADYGINVEKVKDSGNLLFIGFSLNNTYLKVEINHTLKKLNPLATRFERVDGTFTDVLALSPEGLIAEKINAYSDRRFIRDIYDVYILSEYAKKEPDLKKKVNDFLSNIAQPVDEEDLKVLIYAGPVPSFQSMVSSIKARFS